MLQSPASQLEDELPMHAQHAFHTPVTSSPDSGVSQPSPLTRIFFTSPPSFCDRRRLQMLFSWTCELLMEHRMQNHLHALCMHIISDSP